MEIPVYIYFPTIIALSHTLSFYIKFNRQSIRRFKTHYFNEDIFSKPTNRVNILEILLELERNGIIRKIKEDSSTFTFVDNVIFLRSNIYFIPKDSTKLYFRGLGRSFSINKNSKNKILNKINEISIRNANN